MMRLTDVELSMVLSQNEAGHLDHFVWRSSNDTDCGCVASVVFDLPPGAWGSAVSDVAYRTSRRLSCALEDSGLRHYPSEPEEMLSLLAKAGL